MLKYLFVDLNYMKEVWFNMNKKTFMRSLKDSLPVMAGYIIMGMGFGVLLRHSGHSFIWAPIMAITILGGSMQYVAVELLGGATFLTTAIMTVMINARYFFYGLSMLGKYREVKKGRWYLIFALTDETYSLTSTFDETKPENKGISKHGYYITLSALNHFYWIVGCTVGALLGGLSGFDSNGMEFAMTALFVTIFVDQWIENKNHFPALFGLGLSLLCLFIFGTEHFAIPTMIVLTLVLMNCKPYKSKKEAAQNE